MSFNSRDLCAPSTHQSVCHSQLEDFGSESTLEGGAHKLVAYTAAGSLLDLPNLLLLRTDLWHRALL